MYHIICVGGETQMLTYAGSSATGCASQHLSWLYSTFNFVSHFAADVAAELEQLPADRRIGCSVHRGCIFTFRYFWKTFCEPPVSQCVLVFLLIADLLRREEASTPAGVWTTVYDPSTRHRTARRILRPKISPIVLGGSLLFPSTPLFISHQLVQTKHTSITARHDSRWVRASSTS